MKAKGKKYYDWIKARAKIIKRAVEEGRITINQEGNILGRCDDCGKYKPLTPDHVRKRSRSGSNTYRNVEWVCTHCHNLRDNYGDPMGKKTKTKKAAYAVEHKCINCKKPTRMFICNHCSKVSIKIPTKR